VLDAEAWSAYWNRAGWPADRKSALAWWRNAEPMPEAASLTCFRTFAPIAVQQLIRDCGLPRAWQEAIVLTPDA